MPDVVADLVLEGHLQPRLQRAAQLFLVALQASHGSSGGLVMSTRDKIDVSRRPSYGPPPGGGSIALMERLLKGLHHHERELLKHLVTAREKPRGALSDYGKGRSAYASQRTAHAFAVGRLTGLLETLAEKIDGPAISTPLPATVRLARPMWVRCRRQVQDGSSPAGSRAWACSPARPTTGAPLHR